MKKIALIIFVLVGMLSLSTFIPLGNTSSKTTVADKISSAGIMAPPSLFPTNATFETKAEVIGNTLLVGVGGSDADYYAQSFKALADYITDAALTLRNYTASTPNFRFFLCNSTPTGKPNISKPMVITRVISNTSIGLTAKRFYFNLTAPVRVQQNKTYWLVVDGYYDQTSTGTVGCSAQSTNPYPDGAMFYSYNNGTSWSSLATYDLDFVVTFSNRPIKAEVNGFGGVYPRPVGGASGTDYYAQSFVALDSYIVDAGIWIANDTGTTPDLRVQIWGNTPLGNPDKNNVIA
ncbi:MAG: choice-of-anchor R domain-containing protein [Candidatus Bathyarchaeia archaeon]|nr:hypothetical protein [Candidatus Bathyarchaeota archaeon A05DMB-4]MDH7595982.1 choice-of-anchor R domain-containing protein [Candidatus Bathyarchaeota archaeon]